MLIKDACRYAVLNKRALRQLIGKWPVKFVPTMSSVIETMRLTPEEMERRIRLIAPIPQDYLPQNYLLFE